MFEIIKPEDSGFKRKNRSTNTEIDNYPFESTPVGYAFFIPDDGTERFYKVQSGRVAYYNRKQRLAGSSVKFSMTGGEKGGEKGVLVTRVV